MALAATALYVPAPLLAQAASVDIPAQPVESAIVALGRQTGVQVIAVRSLVSGKTARRVRGNLPPGQALERMLAGTGLVARQSGPNTFIVVAAPAPPAIAAARRPAPPRPPRPVPQTAQRAAAPAPVAPAEAIIVTGSRVIVNGNELPTPVTVTTADELLDNDPSSMVAAIYELPALLGSLSPTTNINTGGLNTINLRGIGATRALLMVDNKRAGPTAATNTVNPDVIPQILLKRVDVVTGGVSAIYGSDAVAGVINFVTDTAFTGFKAHVQNGLSTYGDDGRFDAGAAIGKDFAGGRGHFIAGVQFRDAPGITSRQARPFLADTIWSEQGTVPGGGAPGSPSNPYALIKGAVLGTASFGGLITSGPLADLQFGRNSQLGAFRHGAPTGTPGVEIGGDGAYFVNSSLSAAQRIGNGYGRVEFTASDRFGAYAALSLSRVRQGFDGQNPFFNGVSIAYGNPFLASVQPQYRAIIAAQDPAASFRVAKMAADLPNYRSIFRQAYYQASVGANGQLGQARWNLDFVRSSSRMEASITNNISAGRLAAALDAVTDGTGKVVCRAALLNPQTYGGCTPLNLLGEYAASPEAIGYITQSTRSITRLVMDDASATIRGTAGSTAAGPVRVALSGEWRLVSYGVDSNASGNDPVDCAGINYNCTRGTAPWLGGSTDVRTPVSQTVTEGAVEVDAPLVADRPAMAELGVNLATRYTHYNTSGDAWTWKLSGRWQINDAIRLRFTRSHDIRSPSLSDLFAPQSFVRKAFIDSHTGTSGFVTFVFGGNADLTPEKADTLTVGAVITPRGVPGLSLAADFYRISIRNAITQVDGYQPSISALCEASGGTSEVCGLIVRPLPFADRSAANFPTLLRSDTLNVAVSRAWGTDVEVNYATALNSRPLILRLLANWQPHVIFDNGPGGVVDVGGAADGVPGLPALPSVKILASLAYQLTDATWLRLRQRWRSALRQNGNTALTFLDGDVPAVGYTDVSVNHRFNHALTGFINIKNLFNAWPPAYASSGGSSQINYLGGFSQGDDIEGSYFTVGLRLRL